MKALSIQQPWAWLIVNGHKDIENRDWPTKMRGRVYVHAGKKIDKDGLEYIRTNHPNISLPHVFETGGIVGSVNITGCVTESTDEWFFGEYGFVLSEPQVLSFRPYKGMLGFFEVTEP